MPWLLIYIELSQSWRSSLTEKNSGRPLGQTDGQDHIYARWPIWKMVESGIWGVPRRPANEQIQIGSRVNRNLLGAPTRTQRVAMAREWRPGQHTDQVLHTWPPMPLGHFKEQQVFFTLLYLNSKVVKLGPPTRVLHVVCRWLNLNNTWLVLLVLSVLC